ncbi:MAG TPA: hypothetical protein VF529_18595 [Solirubrobacteraceae bacterium]
MQDNHTLATITLNGAFSESQQALQQEVFDQQIFLEYAKAFEAEDRKLYRYIRVNLMKPHLRAGLRDYERTGDDEVKTPLESAAYRNEHAEEAAAGAEEALTYAKDADTAAEEGGRYDVVIVILSLALFFLGIAGVLSAPRIRLAVTGAGSAVLTLSLVLLGFAYF